MGQFQVSSARVKTTCRLKNSQENMNGFKSFCLFALLAGGASAAGPNRRGKNLRGTFPFNQRNGQAASHAAHHEHEHAHAHNAVDARASRQGGGDDVALDIGSIAAAGERCIDKVVMVEETEYDDVVTCKHSYSEKCHTTYTTDFEPQQEEECEENFVKNCFIEFRKIASQETVEFCHTPLKLEGGGPEVCQTVYESACTTRYEQHDVDEDTVECETITEEKCEDVTQGYTTEQKCTKWPVQKCKASASKTKKYSPNTSCKKVPREICGEGTVAVPQGEEFFDRQETVIQEVPTEACSRSRTNPRKVQKPVVKKWCYVPTAQSG